MGARFFPGIQLLQQSFPVMILKLQRNGKMASEDAFSLTIGLGLEMLKHPCM